MSFPKTLTLNTKNLKLRIPSLDDIPTIFSASRYEGFTDGMLWEPPEKEEDCIKPYYSSIKAWEEGGGYTFAIDQRATQEFVARIVIRKTKEADIWNIGFWTHPKFQGKGIMTEAVEAILRFGFEQLGAKQIEAAYATWNKGSEKVLQRNGFTHVRLIEQGYFKHGKWVAEHLVAINRTDWNK